MAESDLVPPPAKDLPGDPREERGAGRLLDAAGIAAGVLIVLICADIWTDGKLISRRLLKVPPPQDEAAGEQ
jgi:hypothetical protein